MIDIFIDDYLEKNPLQEDEIQSGFFFRVASCLRGNEGSFEDGATSHIWILLCGSRGGQQDLKPIRAIAFKGNRRIPSGIRFFSSCPNAVHQWREGNGSRNEIWSLVEYAVTIPDVFERVFFRSDAGRGCALGRSLRRELLDGYYRGITNASTDPRYESWLEAVNSRLRELPVPQIGPKMSIVTPAYKTPPELLRSTVSCVLAQTYPNWELIVVNASPDDEDMRAVLHDLADPRIKIVTCNTNLGIVGNTNLGIGESTGDYISFLDHDDEIEPQTLAEFVRVIQSSDKPVDMLYCDEDNLDSSGNHILPVIKPNFSPDVLLSNNYICHLLTIRRCALDEIELSNDEVNGAQDYDLSLKISEKTSSVVRVPHVLYHWRMCEGSTAEDPNSKRYAITAGSTAIKEHLLRTSIQANVSNEEVPFTYRVSYQLPQRSYNLVVFSQKKLNVATKANIKSFVAKSNSKVDFVYSLRPETVFSEIFSRFDGDALALFIPGDCSLSSSAIHELIATVFQTGIFSVSPRVIRDDDLIDSAGSLVFSDGYIGKMSRLLPRLDPGYIGRTVRPYDYLVPNCDCCIVDFSKVKDRPIVQFSTLKYQLASSSVDMWENGFRNVYWPFAEVSLQKSRSYFEDRPSAIEMADARLFVERFPWISKGDPTHNPSFEPGSLYYTLGSI